MLSRDGYLILLVISLFSVAYSYVLYSLILLVRARFITKMAFLLAIISVLEMSRNRLVIALAYAYSLDLARLIGCDRYAFGFLPATWQRAQR